jgi:hypothetical protein
VIRHLVSKEVRMRRRFKGASVDATEAGGEVAATEAGEGPER